MATVGILLILMILNQALTQVIESLFLWIPFQVVALCNRISLKSTKPLVIWSHYTAAIHLNTNLPIPLLVNCILKMPIVIFNIDNNIGRKKSFFLYKKKLEIEWNKIIFLHFDYIFFLAAFVIDDMFLYRFRIILLSFVIVSIIIFYANILLWKEKKSIFACVCGK